MAPAASLLLVAKQQVMCRAWGEDMLLSDGDNSSANAHSLILLLVYSGFRMEKSEIREDENNEMCDVAARVNGRKLLTDPWN